MFVYSLSQCLAIKMTCTNTQTTGVSEHNYKICDTHYLDTVCQRIAISLLKPAFIMLRVTGVLAQAALGHYYHHTTWPVYGKSQNDSIKTPECKHQQQYSWERFHRYICEARDHEEELSNIRKKLYRSPHNRQAIYSPETWRTNKITRQLHQLAPHFTTLIHQQACFRDDFPPFSPSFCSIPAFFCRLISTQPLLRSSSRKAPVLPSSLVRSTHRRPPLPRADATFWNTFGVLLRGLLPILLSLGKRSVRFRCGVLHSETCHLWKGNTTTSGRSQK